MSALQASEAARGLPAEELAAPYELRETVTGRAVFACRSIPSGTRLFGEDDWIDEDERKSFSHVSAEQLEKLTPAVRTTFLRFAYNTTPEEITGSFHPERVRHPVNFINHSCEPNAGYDGADAIVALRRIFAGEEICMDYGTFSFSFDHEFACRCGSPWCRGQVRREDWRELVRAGLRLPRFMRVAADRALWG